MILLNRERNIYHLYQSIYGLSIKQVYSEAENLTSTPIYQSMGKKKSV